MFTNKVIAIACGLLFTAIILDGRAYNREAVRSTIFNVPAYPEIKIKKNGQQIMAFGHRQGRWHITKPFIAPVQQSRIDALLATNHATGRQYLAADLKNAGLFSESVTLEIGTHSFKFGQQEPVSKLRYVQASEKIYLQSDNVIPLLKAGKSAFIDLNVTGKVNSVTVNSERLEDIGKWSYLQSLGIISAGKTIGSSLAEIKVLSDKNLEQYLSLHVIEDTVVLMVKDGKYGYMLGNAQVKALGLDIYL